MIENSIKLTLPMPISVNSAYGNKKNSQPWKWRYKTQEYKNWESLAEVELRKQKECYIEWDKWLAVQYTYFTNILNKNWTKKIKDVFNFEKTLSDFLASNIEWFKDHKIKKWTVEKHNSDREEVEIIIYELN